MGIRMWRIPFTAPQLTLTRLKLKARYAWAKFSPPQPALARGNKLATFIQPWEKVAGASRAGAGRQKAKSFEPYRG